MSRIFISYRRTDSVTITGRLHDRLVIEFDDDAVFKDVDDIPLGADFRTVLDREVGRCAVQLVIIGPEWLAAADGEGHRRLNDPDDFVRIEVEAGLRRDEVLVIPVLVKGAGMPSSADLPPSLRELVFRNAAIIRDDPDFHRDMSRLVHQIRQHMDQPQVPAVAPSPLPEPAKTAPPKASPQKRPAKVAPRTERPSGRSRPWMWAVVALVFLVLMAVFIGTRGGDGDDGATEWDGRSEGMVVATEDEGLMIAVALDAEYPDDALDIARGVELAHHFREVVYIGDEEIPWEIYELESSCSEESGALAEAFVGDNRVIGVVGHACNDGCLNTMPIYNDAGYTTISPFCANPELIQSDESGGFLRTVPPDVPPEVFVADFVRNYLGHHSIATIHGASGDSISRVNELARHFNEMGGEVLSLAITSPEDVFAVLDRLDEHYVESVYFAGEMQYGAMLLTEADLFRHNNITLILADGSQKHEFADALGGDPGIDVYAVYPQMPDWQDTPPDLLASFQEFHGSPPQTVYAIAAFAATNMFLDAAEEYGAIGDDGTVWIARDSLRDFLRNYDAESPAGYLLCGGDGNCLPVPVIIYKLAEDGSYDEVDFR